MKGIVDREFVPSNTVVNSDFYCDVLRCLRASVQQKRPELWRNHPHPPYSLVLAPCDFALFAKLKMKLKGRRFQTVSDIQTESQAVLASIKENDFHSTFEVWKK
jgi:hypothetical protein